MNYSFEATGFWKWESGQKTRGNRHGVWAVGRSLFCFGLPALPPSLPPASRAGIRWIFLLYLHVVSCCDSAETIEKEHDREKMVNLVQHMEGWTFWHSLYPWQLKIIKWCKKSESKSLTWTILQSFPAAHIIDFYWETITAGTICAFLESFEWGNGHCVLYYKTPNPKRKSETLLLFVRGHSNISVVLF